MDPITALLGLGIEDQDQTQALADRLRGRQRAADFFSISTIDPIAQGAQAEQASILESAKTAGGLRKAMAERAAQDERARLNRVQQQSMQTERLAQQQANADRTMQYNLDNDLEAFGDTAYERARQARLDREKQLYDTEKLEIDRMKARGGEAAPYGAKGFEYTEAGTAEERAEEKKMGKDAMSFVDLADSYESSFGPTVPLTGAIENKIGEYIPFASDKMRDQTEWWKNWKSNQELVQRHDMFGSALTTSEQESWKAAKINENTDPRIVKEWLRKGRDYSMRLAEATAAEMILKGRHPTTIKQSVGGLVNIPELIKKVASGEYDRELEARNAQDRAERASRGIDSASLPSMDDIPENLNDLSIEQLRELAR